MSVENAVDDETGQPVLFMVDPAVLVPGEGREIPIESIAGARELASEGEPRRFRPNPVYVRSTPDSPSDPVDLMLRLVGRGEATDEDLLGALAETAVAVALDADGVALLDRAPDDDVPCVVVTTAPAHRVAVEGEADLPVRSWREVSLDQLAGAAIATGVDVLLNPGGRAAMRLTAAAVAEAATLVQHGEEDPVDPEAVGRG